MQPKMIIQFIGKKSRTTRHHLLPIYLRVTIEKKRFEVATRRKIDFLTTILFYTPIK